MAKKTMALTIEEMDALLDDKGLEEIKARIRVARSADINKAARETAKNAISIACLAFIDDKLAPLAIPDGIMGISMVFPYIPADNSFMVSETGLKIDYGEQLKVSDEIKHLVSLAEARKKKNDNRPQAFLKTGLGDNRYVYITSVMSIEGGVGEQIDFLYSSATAASFNVDGIPEGDQAKVIIRYTKDADVQWFATVTVGKVATVGNGGPRRARTAKPDDYKNWQEKVNKSPHPEHVEARKWLAEKYPAGDWSKSISAPKVLIKFDDAEFIRKRAEADARSEGS